MLNTDYKVGSDNGRTRSVYPSGMVVLHPVAAIAIHTTGWGKRVLAVPPGASERPAEQHS